MQVLSLQTVRVWRIRTLCLAAAGFFLCGILAVFSGTLAVSVGLLTAILFVLACVWYCPQRYRSCRFHITDRSATMAAGVFFYKERTLALPQIQYAELLRTPIQRLCGVSTLILHAAGAKLSIGGLSLEQGTLLFQRINGRETDEQA